MGSTFHELFSGGASVWLKIAGGAIATPVVMAMYALRAERRDGNALPKDPSVLTAILVLKQVTPRRQFELKFFCRRAHEVAKTFEPFVSRRICLVHLC